MSAHDETCEAGDPEYMTSSCRCEERALAALRAKLAVVVQDGVLWEDEGIAHRAALTAHGDRGVAILWVARNKRTDGETIYLTAETRRSLAAALLKDLPEDLETDVVLAELDHAYQERIKVMKGGGSVYKHAADLIRRLTGIEEI